MTHIAKKSTAASRARQWGSSYPASIAATFGLAIEKAAAEYTAAETLLGFLALLAPERIPLSLVTSEIVDDDARADALMVLAAVSLVEITQLENGRPAVNVHRLVRAAMRARLARHGRSEATLEQVTCRLMEAFPEGAYRDPKLWPECSVLLPHVLAVRDHAGIGCQSAATATLFAEAGTWIDNLANLLRDVGRSDEAEPLYRSAIDIFLRTIGEEHSRTARGYRNFAAFLMKTARSQEALRYAELAVSVHERVHGVQHAWTRKSAGVLADVLVALGRPDEATALRTRCSLPPT